MICDTQWEDAGCQPSLVWICASAEILLKVSPHSANQHRLKILDTSQEQIPPDALGIAGSVRCLVGGKEVGGDGFTRMALICAW